MILQCDNVMAVDFLVYRQNPECQNPEISGFCHKSYDKIQNFLDFVIPNFLDFVIKMSQNPEFSKYLIFPQEN